MAAVRRQRLIGLAALAMALAACSPTTPVGRARVAASATPGSVRGGPPATAAPAGPTPTAPATASAAAAAAELQYMGLDFSHPIHTVALDCVPAAWGGHVTLQDVLANQPNLAAAAIMTVVGPTGPAQWNTPDGHRWTQPEAIAARAGGVIPAIERPWTFLRTGPTFAGTVPDSAVVWLLGGSVGDDYMGYGNCIAGDSDPAPDHSYLMLFGPLQNLEPPGAFRVILAAYPYDPVTHAVDGPWGRTWLAPPPATSRRNS